MRPVQSAYQHRPPRTSTDQRSVFAKRLMSTRNQLEGFKPPQRARSALGPRSNPRDVEKQEVSEQLAALKKSYNLFKLEEAKTLRRLQAITFEYQKMQQGKGRGIQDTASGQAKTIQEQLSAVFSQQKQAKLDQHVNLHVLERMRQTKFHLDIKKYNLQQALKGQALTLRSEERKMLKTRETQQRCFTAYQKFRSSLREERADKSFHLNCLEQDQEDQRRLQDKRELRQQRQVDIAEAAANEDWDKRETDLRESLMLSRLWQTFLASKLERSMKDSVIIEQAFNRVKVATGTNEIEKIVEKLLTREQSYAGLQGMITHANERCSWYRDQISDIETKLNRLSMSDNVKHSNSSGLKENYSQQFERLESVKVKKNKVANSHLRIKLWIQRMHRKLSEVEGTPLALDTPNLPQMFQQTLQSIRHLVQQLDSDTLNKFRTQMAQQTLQQAAKRLPDNCARYERVGLRARMESSENLDPRSMTGIDSREAFETVK